ncbi:MAG: alpha-galactosidase [Actinobacteria bacterium]|nr:MAG: alpha-galactosidase [Actinomycetota bacterium]
MVSFEELASIKVDGGTARVYEHGWQSWSPSGSYPADVASSYRPVRPVSQNQSYRPGRPAPDSGFQGEGLLAVDPGTGDPVTVFGASPGTTVPSVRAALVDGHLVVSADGPVSAAPATTIEEGLAAWADGYAAALGVGTIRPAPTGWCSWYHYFTDVTAADIEENVAAIHARDLPVDVIQIDDGWESEIGDWLTLSGRFSSLEALTERIAGTGRRTGIWVAPFLVGAKSRVFAEHPDWLIQGVRAGNNWNQDTYGLDATHPGARDYLRRTFTMLRQAGIDYFKIDFIYAGALDGPRYSGADPITAYRSGVQLIRETIGPDAYLLGCGAPILPSVGLFDAMRVSADVAPHWAPLDGDPAQPSQQGAAFSTVGRAFQHGRFWVNDPDCIVARPAIERREEWAEVVDRYGGLRISSDRIADLDDWGMATTRRLLEETPPPTPFVP